MSEKIESNKKVVLLRKFVLYSKAIAKMYMNLQAHKRQLSEMIQNPHYIVPFSVLDLDKIGQITQKNIQTFLISHKYFLKPHNINRYFLKYCHGKQRLSYDDVMQSLLPHADYVLVATTLKKMQDFKYLCEKTQNKIIQNTVAYIINDQICSMGKDYIMMNDITDGSLHIGSALWKFLDRNHCNQLTFMQFRDICYEYGCQFSQFQWKAFINWHFGTHKKCLNRDDMMRIFNVHNEKKRSKSVCNYQQYTMKQINRKVCEDELKRQKNVEKLVKQRVSYVHELSKSKCQFKELILKQQFPQRTTMKKTLLYDKRGYQVPKKCVKYVELVNE